MVVETGQPILNMVIHSGTVVELGSKHVAGDTRVEGMDLQDQHSNLPGVSMLILREGLSVNLRVQLRYS